MQILSTREKISISHKLGFHREGYIKQAQTLKRRYSSGEIKPWNKGKKLPPISDKRKRDMSIKNSGGGNPFYGKKHSDKSKYKMRLAKLGKKLPEEHKKKVLESLNRFRAEHPKISSTLKGKSYEELYGKEKADQLRESRRINRQGLKASTETLEKMRIVTKKRWQNQEYRDKTIKAQIKGRARRPTSLEQKMIDLIDRYNLPYKYTGNGDFIIDGFCPDFINVVTSKKCIEVRPKRMCLIWNKLTPEQYEKKKKEHYARNGWKCIVIWQEDFSDENSIITKMKDNSFF